MIKKTIKKEVKQTIDVEVNYILPIDVIEWMQEKESLLLHHFITNLGIQKGRNGFDSPIFGNLDKRGVISLFDNAFDWERTNEGMEYWDRISTEWEKWCDENEVEGMMIPM